MASEQQQAKPLFMYSDIANMFECPVCNEFATSPILQCQNGHVICTACRRQLVSCPICRGQLADSRNLFMEQLMEALLFPCQYATSGCTAIVPLAQKKEHEIDCYLRPCPCPHPRTTCKWEGTLMQVMQHVAEQHKDIKIDPSEYVSFIGIRGGSREEREWAVIQSHFGQIFLLVLVRRQKSKFRTQFFAMVLIIGTSQQAKAFGYEIELINGHIRLHWQAEPVTIHDGIQSAIDRGNCLSVSDNMAYSLATIEGNITMKVTISRQ